MEDFTRKEQVPQHVWNADLAHLRTTQEIPHARPVTKVFHRQTGPANVQHAVQANFPASEDRAHARRARLARSPLILNLLYARTARLDITPQRLGDQSVTHALQERTLDKQGSPITITADNALGHSIPRL